MSRKLLNKLHLVVTLAHVEERQGCPSQFDDYFDRVKSVRLLALQCAALHMLVAFVVLLDSFLVLGQLLLTAADLISCQSNLVLGYKLTILGCLASL